MLPFAFEWHWDIGHFIFMGLFYLALLVLVVGLNYAMLASMKDIAIGKSYSHDHGHGDEAEAEGAEAAAEA